MTENEIGKWIVDIAVQLHPEMGPGLLDFEWVRNVIHSFCCH